MDLCQIPAFDAKKKVLVMGVINVTPDSFSDGGSCLDPDSALACARKMIEEGADMIDIGAESSRPGARPVSLDEELSRLRPVLAKLQEGIRGFPISIDTTKAAVAKEALSYGAVLVNDISAGTADLAMFPMVKEAGAAIVLMHMKGTPASMQESPIYRDVIGEISAFFEDRLAAAQAAGIPEEALFLDPGIGFGKTAEHNLEILGRLDELTPLGRPLVVGTSRKSFIGGPVSERLGGTLASSLWAMTKGARILRVHDVKECVQAVELWSRISGHETQRNKKESVAPWIG